MGMYTELFICCRIKNDQNVINILKHMLRDENSTKPQLPEHDLFKTDRWEFMLIGSSCYFVPETVHCLTWNEIGGYWSFISRSDFKNYNNEVSKFINWITPHIEDGDEMIGYSRYEEDREPIIYYRNN